MGADEWVVDPSHSDVEFSVRHMMVSNTKGEFKKFSGTAHIDDADLNKSRVNFEIDVASIDTDDAKRDEHLKGPDFFNVAKHPKITFKSTSIKRFGRRYKVTGDLTMHGVTKSVVLKAKLSKPAQGMHGMIRGVSVSGSIMRKDFNMTWNKTLDAGGLAVGDEVEIEVELELQQKAAKK